MKNFLLVILSILFSIPSIYSQNRLSGTPSAGQTTIRSVVAQGGELRLLLHVAEAGAYQVNIYSADGEIIYREALQLEAGEVEQRIPFAARTHGIYEVNLSGTGEKNSRQLIW